MRLILLLLCVIAAPTTITHAFEINYNAFDKEGFSTYDIDRANKPQIVIDTGVHSERINSIDIDKSQKWFVSSSFDRTIRVWDFISGKLKKTIRPPTEMHNTGVMFSVKISNDSSLIAAGGLSQTAIRGQTNYNSLYLYSLNTGKMLTSIQKLPAPILSLAFSNNDKLIVTALENNGIRIFRINKSIHNEAKQDFGLDLVAEDHEYLKPVYDAEFSPDGKNLITVSWDGSIRVYDISEDLYASNDVTSIRPLLSKVVFKKNDELQKAKYSPDGNKILICSQATNRLIILSSNNLDTLQEIKPADPNTYLSIAWSNDSKSVYAAGGINNYHLIKSGNIVDKLKPSKIIRKWTLDNINSHFDIITKAKGAINNILISKTNHVLYSSIESELGLVQNDKSVYYIKPQKAFFSGTDDTVFIAGDDGKLSGYKVNPDTASGYQDEFRLSSDASIVKFKYSYIDNYHYFNIKTRELTDIPPNELLYAPITQSNTLKVTGWKKAKKLTINGKEFSKLQQWRTTPLSLSFSDNGEKFVLGTTKYLILYNKDGSYLPRGINSFGNDAHAVNISKDNQLVVVAHDDGTIRWYSADLRRPLISFFPHSNGKSWIMWTPEGYFDASPDGTDLIGYHINRGKQKDPDYISLNNLYDVYFRPDIVQAKIRGEDIAPLITLTAEEALKHPPPTIVFNSTSITNDSIISKVCYQVKSSGGGIGEVRVFHNGKLIKSDGYYRENIVKSMTTAPVKLASVNSRAIYDDLRGLAVKEKSDLTSALVKSKGDIFEECMDVEPVAGSNEVSVAAFNSTNTVQSSLETTTFTSNRKPEEPHLYILSVGIDKYRDASINLKYAAKDANDFLSQLPKQAISLYKPQNIHLVSVADEKATKAGIMAAINDLSNKVKHGDSFLFFNASHGVLLQNQYYIVTADFDGDLSSTKALISSNEIVEMSKKIKSLSQLYIFDTCHAGGVDNIISGLYDARMSVLAKKMGLHIYASAGSVQTAMDGYKGNGLYTHTLLQGILNGKEIDKEKTGKVTVKTLGLYTKEKTAELSKQLGHPQTPYIINFGKDNPLFTVQ